MLLLLGKFRTGSVHRCVLGFSRPPGVVCQNTVVDTPRIQLEPQEAQGGVLRIREGHPIAYLCHTLRSFHGVCFNQVLLKDTGLLT